MVKFTSPENLESYHCKLQTKRKKKKPCISVCGGTGCRANAGLKVAESFRKALLDSSLDKKVDLQITGCHGFCERGPLVVIRPQGILYVSVKPDDVEEIIHTSIVSNGLVERLAYKLPDTRERIINESEIPFYTHQQRIIFGHSGKIDPTNIDDYLAVGGYAALAKALGTMAPDEIIDWIEQSGLRGRGGGGFLTGRKWRSCRRATGYPKYVLCNGDEGDPGAFMDRSIMEGNPHSVLEGIAIGAFAIGSSRSYIYVRQEYPLAVENLRIAIKQAEERGLLGNHILGSDFSLHIELSRGAGAFVCGESTALIASIEGFSGEPRAKHIHTSEKGLFSKPTVLNNVETWANVPIIIQNGWEWFSKIGTDTSKGTKVFSLVGKVKNTGLVEVPMGMSLRKIIFEIGGGVTGKRRFKAVQTGGPSGGCLPESQLDLPVDFDQLGKAGSMMGSGGMIVMDDHTCMVEVARYFTEFLTKESCGKCVACREGLLQMLRLLEKITSGTASEEDINDLEEIGQYVRDNSLCGLGKTAANPTLSTLRYFRDEYIDHTVNHTCPAGVCRELTVFSIVPDACRACGKCLKSCPVEAITGRKKTPHVIDQNKCIKCGLCREVCPFDAVHTHRSISM